MCESQGLLILEKVAMTTSVCRECSHESHDSHVTMQRSHDLRALRRQQLRARRTHHHRPRLAGRKCPGKRSIFDIFWEQFHAPLGSEISGRKQCPVRGFQQTEVEQFSDSRKPIFSNQVNHILESDDILCKETIGHDSHMCSDSVCRWADSNGPIERDAQDNDVCTESVCRWAGLSSDRVPPLKDACSWGIPLGCFNVYM